VSRSSLRWPLAAVVFALVAAVAGADEAKKVPVLQKWDGKVKDETLRKASPTTGYIANEKDFEKLWKAWRPDEKVPKVDFKEELVVVGVADGPNQVNLIPQVNDKGDLSILARATLVGGPGFSYQIATIKREGIKTVKGKPIAND
jgi:hypothetical protein